MTLYVVSKYKGIYHSNILYKDLNNFDISSNDKKINFERNNQTIIGVINNSSFNNQLDINFPKIEEKPKYWELDDYWFTKSPFNLG